MSAPSHDQVFISYSHRDKKWLDRLLVFLKPFQRQGLQVWADPYIQVGERWRRVIEGALERACIGVLLVSQDFLASDFIYEQELPPLKRAADQGHLVLICVPVSASTYRVSGLEVYQWPCDPEQPLDSLPPSKRNHVLVKISQAIHEAVLRYAPPPEPKAAAVRTAVANLVAGEGLGRLHGVPPQRPHYISRPEELARLKQRLFGSTAPTLGITGTTQSVGVHGMGGIGKTVLAIALVNEEEEVRRHFTDGVYWMTFGQNAALETLQAELLRALTGRLDAMASVEQGRARLAEVLADKACLLVLDDVWKAEDAVAFAPLGPHGRMLLTTRDAALLTALGAEEASLEVMQSQAALALLAEWSGQPRASLPREAERLAEACGHLPLALALAGAQGRDGRAWADLLHALRDGKLEFLDHPYGSVFGSMRMSVNALPADTARRYYALAVFPEDVPIPQATVARLWAHTGGLKAYQTRALLVELQRKNLLQLYEGVRALGFHDLQQDYLRIAVNDLPALHGALLTAYEKEVPDGPAPDRWARLPQDDPYLWRNLVYHLDEAGRHEELRALRLSFPWLRAKLRVTELNALIADYGGCPRDDAPGRVRDALRLSAHVLERDPAQLASQLCGRLDNSGEAGIQELLGAAARGESGPWLRPLRGTLTPPGGPLLRTLEGHTAVVTAVALTAEGRALSGSADRTLKLWDLASGECLATFTADAPIPACALAPDGRTLVAGDSTGRVHFLRLEGV